MLYPAELRAPAAAIAGLRQTVQMGPACWLLLALLLLVPDGRGVAAATEPPFLAELPAADQLHLVDGRVVRLAGIHVPTGPVAAQARAAVAEWLPPGAAVRLPEQMPLDRHGRLLAQVHDAEGRWLQERLVQAGLALVAPNEAMDLAAAQELLLVERQARAARRGLWHDPDLVVQRAGRVEAPVGTYILVEGRVQAVARGREFVYLNFGADWRRDFTIRASFAQARQVARAGLDLELLAGRNLEVRGWLFEADGPMIEVVHPAQIEVVP